MKTKKGMNTMDIYEESVLLHKKLKGKLTINSKMPINNKHDLSLAYTPGVAEACREIDKDQSKAYELTIKNNTVAIVSDGSAVLGLGNIGPLAALPVMEGKAMLFKEYADIDAFPLCINTQDTQTIIELVKNISPTFGGINLEDISAPRCFEIEKQLQEIGIPVFHDDQHGTAIVVFAALINAAKLAGKELNTLKVVINGAGAAGRAITELLLGINYGNAARPVGQIIICDSKGIVHKNRSDIKDDVSKSFLADVTNPDNIKGSLKVAMKGSDVFIGVSKGNLVTKEMVASMDEKSILFPMANPTPEIMPDLAKEAGAFIVGTGRSDFNNQINNVLAFPGIFRGAMDAKAKQITNRMKLAAAFALAESVLNPTPEYVIPSPLDKEIAKFIAQKVKDAANEKNTCN